ncbi:MAG: T9SS type A sorting domain-containing protein [Lewinellaceae bacterium]|nr:T9SS type A sorting domain-containing protein [Lewinellaceae bacterium]
MRNIKFTVLLLLCAGWSYGQQSFQIAGGRMNISNGTSLVLEKTIWKNNSGSETTGTGSVLFSGDATGINIGGSSATQFSKLIIDNPNNVFAEQNLAVMQELNFQNGKLDLQNANLTLAGNTTNLSPDRYVKTSGTGVVIRGLTTGAEYLFPVGNSSYNPLVLQDPSGGSNQFAVRVADAVRADGSSGAALTTDAVARSWYVWGTGGEYPNLQIRAGWSSPDELPGFDRNAAYLARYTGSNWDLLPAIPASGADPYTLARTGGSVPAIYAVLSGDITPPSALCQDITVELDATGMASITAAQIDGGSSDVNGIVSYVLDVSEFSCTNVGINIVTLTLTDPADNSSTCTATVTVADNLAPSINLEAEAFLWPPNHNYVTIPVEDMVADVTDNCAGLTIADVVISYATSDEPEDAPGGGDGNTLDDILIDADCQAVSLRKERMGGGNGRVYTVHLELTDVHGNTATAQYLAKVKNNNGNNGTAIDDGPAYSESCGVNQSIVREQGTDPATYLRRKNLETKSGQQNPKDDTSLANLRISPNPFAMQTTIRFRLPMTCGVQLEVYDLEGKQLRTLVSGALEAGAYSVDWDGKSGSGYELPEGNYLLRLITGQEIRMKQVVLIR